MKLDTTRLWKGLAFSVAGVFVFSLIYIALTGTINLVKSESLRFFIIFTLGLVMSTFSGSRFVLKGEHRFPPKILSILKTLGYLSFAILILTPLFTKLGFRVPLIYGYEQGFISLSVIIAIKWLLVRSSDLLRFFK